MKTLITITAFLNYFYLLQSSNSRLSDTAEGFGYPVSIDSVNTTAAHPSITDSRTVMFQPLSGIFQQTKYLPLRYAPLEIELELSDQTDPVVSKVEDESSGGNVSKPATLLPRGKFRIVWLK